MGILITGMHRSGTSLTAGLVNLLGMPMGDGPVVPNSPENPRGIYERADVMKVNNQILEVLGGSWSSPPASNYDLLSSLSDELVKEKRESLSLFSEHNSHWFVKDPRLSLLLPFWDRMALQALPTIFVIRHPLEVAQSLKLRNAIPHRLGLALWATYTNSALNQLTHRNNLIIDYSSILKQKQASIRSLEKFINSNSKVKTIPSIGFNSLDEMEFGDISNLKSLDVAAT